jgi:hypothetical protein
MGSSVIVGNLLVEQCVHPFDGRDVGELEGIVRRGLDDEGAAPSMRSRIV